MNACARVCVDAFGDVLSQKRRVLVGPRQDPARTWQVKVVEVSAWKKRTAWETTKTEPASAVFKWRRDSLRVQPVEKPLSPAHSGGVSYKHACMVTWTCEYTLPEEAETQTQARAGAGAGAGAAAGAGDGPSDDVSKNHDNAESDDSTAEPPIALDMREHLHRVFGCGPRQEVSLFPAGGPRSDGDASNVLPPRVAAQFADGTCAVLDVTDNTFKPTAVTAVRVGDVVQVESGGVFPADMLLVYSTSPDETAVNQEVIDGSSDLRRKRVVTVDGPPGAGAGSGAVGDAAAPSPDAAAPPAPPADDTPLVCPVCTVMVSEPGATSCSVCGTPFGGGAGGGSSDSDAGDWTSLWSRVGSGAANADVLDRLRAFGTLLVPPSRADGSFPVRFKRAASAAAADDAGADDEADKTNTKKTKFDHEQLLAAACKLVFTQRVVGVVTAVGDDTRLALCGGCVQGVVRTRRQTIVKAASKAWKAVEETLKRQEPWAPPPVPPAEYEAATGMSWQSTWHDVPDDGNCLLHAVWLALKALREYFPQETALPDEEPLPESAEDFRRVALAKLAGDATYVESIGSMLRLWLELDGAVLLQIEDVFTLPAAFQEKIITLNQAVKLRGFEDVDFDALAAEYVALLGTPQVINGRTTFLPLGEAEITAFRRVYQVRMQTVKSEAVGEDGDPRTPPPHVVNDQMPPEPVAAQAHRRIVRLLNVKTNHYKVHLPRKRDADGK